MPFYLFVSLSLSVVIASAGYAGPSPQYLLFHIFNGAVDPTGVYRESLSAKQILALVQHIAATVEPPSAAPNRILGFDIGPIASDQGPVSAISVINAAFDVALATNLAVAIHLDDWMFWKNATFPDGSSLLGTPGTTEWSDWNGDPAPPLSIGWLPNNNLAPQMCYESASARRWAQYWLLNVIGPAVKAGYQRLIAAGKPQQFAGIFAGWESNAVYGYCSLTHLGYSAANPPANFLTEKEYVLSRHISLWAQYLAKAGIPSNLIYTHLAWPTVEPWVAFNPYSQSGWTNYVWPGDFSQIYGAVGPAEWVQAEGSNVSSGDCVSCPPSYPSPYNWESYLAASYNHGASLVTIFGAFQGESGAFASATGPQAIAAYQKFMSGAALVEDTPFP